MRIPAVALLAASAVLGLFELSASAQEGVSRDELRASVEDDNAMIVAQPWEVLRVTPPPIINTIIVEGSLEDAWALWTDSERMPEFMGFEADISPKAGGAYKVLFVPDAATPLERGNDGRILAIEPYRMLSFTWMTPMHMSELSGNSTVVTLYFTPLDQGRRVQVDLINIGYGQGPAWRDAYTYNLSGWDRVLAHFEYAMEEGPIDWGQRAQDLRRDKTLPMWREYKRKVLRGEDPYARATQPD